MSYEENVSKTITQLSSQMSDAAIGLKEKLMKDKPEGEKLVGMISVVFGIDEDGSPVIIACRTKCMDMESAPVPILLALQVALEEHAKERGVSLHAPN